MTNSLELRLGTIIINKIANGEALTVSERIAFREAFESIADTAENAILLDRHILTHPKFQQSEHDPDRRDWIATSDVHAFLTRPAL
jgi:hypothetical protein